MEIYRSKRKNFFDLYKQFLSTRNELFLRQAQRRFEMSKRGRPSKSDVFYI